MRNTTDPTPETEFLDSIQISSRKSFFTTDDLVVVLTGMEAKLMELERRQKKTRAMKQAMIQELLAGRTRMV